MLGQKARLEDVLNLGHLKTGCKSGDCDFRLNYLLRTVFVFTLCSPFAQNKSCLAKRFPAAARHSPAAPSCARQRSETMAVQRLVKWNPYIWDLSLTNICDRNK